MEITIETIVSVFKNYSDQKRLKDIKAAVVSLVTPSDEIVHAPEDIENIERQVENLIKEDKRRDNESFLKYSQGKYRKRPKRVDPKDAHKPANAYVGAAGETAVISELMFNGYNANRMMIDEGVDIVATKNNIYYYIQVKTAYVESGRIYCQIDQDRYDAFIQSQIRYIIVARYNDKGLDRNMFFVFNSHDIDKGIHDRYIKLGQNCVSIKIKFHPQSGAPYLYDEKECDASYHLNNFKLV